MDSEGLIPHKLSVHDWWQRPIHSEQRWCRWTVCVMCVCVCVRGPVTLFSRPLHCYTKSPTASKCGRCHVLMRLLLIQRLREMIILTCVVKRWSSFLLITPRWTFYCICVESEEQQSCKCWCQDEDVSGLVDAVCGLSESESNEWLGHFHLIVSLIICTFCCCHLSGDVGL